MKTGGLSQGQKAAILLLLIVVVSVVIRSEYVLEDGTLLLRYDPYYHYRMAETIVQEGHRPEWDYIASWPTGEPGDRHPPLYHYFLAYTFTVFKGLVDNDLLTWCSYSCIIPVILFVVLAFFVGREFTDLRGGLFSALLFALAGSTVARTLIGFADTDGFILVFSLLASLFWIKSLSGPRRLFYSVLAGFSIFLFELTWVGYWHMLLLLVGASFAFVIIHFYVEKEIDMMRAAFLLLGFLIPHMFYSHSFIEGVILVGIAGVLFASHKKWQQLPMKKWQPMIALCVVVLCVYFLYSEGLIRTSLYQPTEPFKEQENVFYPYLGPYISQRQEVTLPFLLESFATTLFLAPLGILVLFKERNKKSYALCVFLVLYVAGGTVMAFAGLRFLLLLSVPVLLSSSVTLSWLWNRVKGDSPGRKVVALCCVALLVTPVYIAAERVNYTERQLNDDWFKALQWIDQNTPDDSVVIADWENGYWVESIAKRKSVMNGGHYDIYWRLLKFGMMLQTKDEEVAVKEVFGFTSTSEVEKLRNFPEGDIGSELREKERTSFAVEQQDAYIILGPKTALVFDFVSFFGTWDYTTGTGVPTYIYGGAPAGTVFRPQWKQHLYDTKEFPVVIYEAGGEYHGYIMEGNYIVPTAGTMYWLDGNVYYLKREDGTNGIIWYYPDSLLMVIPPEAEETMLVRLYFFNGDGLEYFELVGDFGTVKVYKVHREGQDTLNEGVYVKMDEWSPA